MNIWIDIDKVELIPFYKLLINELEGRGHKVIVTAEDNLTIKIRTKEENINADYIGNVFSFFGFFLQKSIILRSSLLIARIHNEKINIAFSFGSKSMLFAAINLNLNLILFADDFKEKISQIHFALENIYFIIPDVASEQPLIEKGFDLKKIAKFKGSIQKDALNSNSKAIKDIVNKIELFSSHQDIKA